MDPLENDFQYSPDEQEEHQRQQDALQDLLRRQQEEAAQQAEIEAAETPDPEETPRTQSEVFQNPLGDIPGAAQQASDSTREGMGQMFEAIGGAMDNVLGSISEERSEERDADRKAGKGGDERNVVGALQGLVQQGLDLLPEELTRDRGLDVGPKLDDMSESDRVMAGTVLGTGESLLEFGELVGDFSKTLASKANIVGYDPKDDPFSNQYNWASWNLGKDELGAQTGVGKIAQGFGEFALTFYATGGGKAAGQLFTTGLKQAGAKGILSAAGKEALEGVAADMVLAASGEGNLSNLIRDHAPEWYPTWLSALAVDGDDNPFEAALKTAFEGSLLGFPVGAISGYIAGVRAIEKAIAENLKPEVIRQRGIEAAQRKLFHGTSKEGAEGILTKGFRTSRNQIMPGSGVYFAEDPRYAGMYAYSGGLNYGNADGTSVTGSLDNLPDQSGEVFGGMLPAGTQILDIPATGLSLNKFARKKGLKGVRGVTQWAKENGFAGIRYSPDFDEAPGTLRPGQAGKYREGFSSSAGYEYFIFDPKVADQIIGGDPAAFMQRTDLAALQTVRNMERVGIQPTWDDVAAVVPDLFIPGSRQIEAPEFHPNAMKQIADLDPTDPDAGLSVHPFTGETPTDGTFVAIDGVSVEAFDRDSIGDFIAANYDLLTRDDVYLGAFISPITKKPVIELARQIKNVDEATQLGRLFDQEGVFNLDNFEYIPTGGLDQLKKSKGEHLKALSSRPVQATTVPAQKAATQSIKADKQLSSQGGSERMLTNAQVRRLGEAGPSRTEELLKEFRDDNQIDVKELAAEARMTEDEVVQAAMEGLGDDYNFLAANVKDLDLNDEGYLSRAGIVQSRLIMRELSHRLASAVQNSKKADDLGFDNLEHMKDVAATLKAFMREYKVSANLNSKRLSAGGIDLPAEFGTKRTGILSMEPVDANDIAKAFDNSEKMIDKMIDGLEKGDPKAKRTSRQIATQLELMGDQPYRLAQGISTLSEIGTKYALKIMYNSMLSSPATHIVNTVSNAVAVVLRPLAAQAGGDLRSRKAAAASFHALGETMSDAMKLASAKWHELGDDVKGIDTSTGEASLALDELELRAQESNDDGLKRGVAVMRIIEGFANLPGMALPSRMLSTADEFFKAAIQRMEYKRMMMEEAIDMHGSDTQAIFEHLLKKNKQLNFTTSGATLNRELERLAKEVTFQQDLQGTAKKFGDWVESYPPLRVFFPFVRTAHNVATYTASYVPVLGGKLAKLEGKLADPNVSSYEKAIIKGRQRLGAGFIGAAGILAANGMLTGNGPQDPVARKRWLEQNQPRSLKIGDVFISLDRLEPFGPILSAVADIHYAVANGEMKAERGEWFAGYLIQTMALNVTDRTFFSGFKDMAALISPSGGGVGKKLVTFGLDTANNLIPAAGLRRMVVNMVTPYMQEFDEQWDRTFYTSGIGAPFSDHATSYDFITGEPVGAMNTGINALLPIKINVKKQDPVKQALLDIEYNSDKIVEELGKSGVKLQPEHISYLQQHMGSSQLHQRLKDIVTANWWKNDVKAYKNAISKGERLNKQGRDFYKSVHNTITVFADDAMAALKQKYPELQEALDDYQDLQMGGLREFYQQ